MCLVGTSVVLASYPHVSVVKRYRFIEATRVACLDGTLRRRRWIIHRKLENWKSGEIASALRVDERTVYRWWRIYRKYGWEGLQVKSRAPHQYYKTPKSTVDIVLELRRSKHWGPNKIEGYLRNYSVRGIAPVSHRTIHRILVEAGLNNPTHLLAEEGLG